MEIKYKKYLFVAQGPQTTNRVVIIPRSTQWKLQEFLSSKEASDLVNLLVIGESLTSDPSKVHEILEL